MVNKMFFELREYKTQPSKRASWVEFMEEVIIPFQESKGMIIVGSFVGQDDGNLYVWIRRFASELERIKQYKDVYESDHWKKNIEPKISSMLDIEKAEIKLVKATKSSKIK